MLKTKIFVTQEKGRQRLAVIFGWDAGKKEVVILKDTKNKMGEEMLGDSYRGKDGKRLGVKDGRKFIEELCFALQGAMVRASVPYEE